MQKENSQNLENNGQISPTLRQICNAAGMDRPRLAHGEGIRKEFPVERAGEVRSQANRIVEKTAKHWEIT
jgi:hypothetical protein